MLIKAKLFINRIPSPHQSIWYVATMKCIHIWENCKKFICGRMSKSNAECYCMFDEDRIPDDDHIAKDCKNLKDVQIMDRTYRFSSSEVIDNSKSKNVLISYEIDKAYSYLGANDHDSSSSDDDNNNVYENDE